MGLNAIVLHVRTAADAMYPSELVPWSAFLSGTSGVAPKPAYDPLAFAVAETHARGMQLHAWFNPFRAMLPNFAGKAAASHVTRAHRSWIRTYGTQTWIDPGEPAARAAVLEEMMEVVDRYDIDAVHLDDYFYPYRERRPSSAREWPQRCVCAKTSSFPTPRRGRNTAAQAAATRAVMTGGARTSTSSSRPLRDRKGAQALGAVGISPFGIWRPGSPPGITGLDSYAEMYADSRKWLREGWLDYIAPQLYWPITGAQGRFSNLDDWWRTQNPKGRAIWPGLFDAQVAVRTTGWSPNEMSAQVERLRYTREGSGESNGHIHFRLSAMLKNSHAIGERLRTGVYSEPALFPAMPWLGAAKPEPPRITPIGVEAVQVAPGSAIPIAWWMVQTLGLDGRWRMTLRRGTERRIDFNTLGDIGGHRVAITAVDRVARPAAQWFSTSASRPLSRHGAQLSVGASGPRSDVASAFSAMALMRASWLPRSARMLRRARRTPSG